MKRQILLDMDTGIDDAIALAYAALSPAVDVLAVGSVHGNVEAGQAALNSLRILEMAGRTDIPVAVGSSRPLTRELDTAEFIHGDDGLGNTWLPSPSIHVAEQHAVEQIIQTIQAKPHEVEIVATGPLTNLALTVSKEPDIAKAVKGITIMGGAFKAPGNVTEVAEANIWHDPEAADIVIRAGWPITFVSLDVTTSIHFNEVRRAQIRHLGTSVPIIGLIDQMLDFYCGAYYGLGGRNCPIHDPLTVGVAIDPSISVMRKARVNIETRGVHTRGMTITDRREVNGGSLSGKSVKDSPVVSIVESVDGDRFFADLLSALKLAAL